MQVYLWIEPTSTVALYCFSGTYGHKFNTGLYLKMRSHSATEKANSDNSSSSKQTNKHKYNTHKH